MAKVIKSTPDTLHQPAKATQKRSNNAGSNSSIPTFGTNTGLNSDELGPFLYEVEKLWQHQVAENERYPYRLAKIVHHNYDLKKRWYVIFYAWDVSQEKLVRKRLFDPINRQKTTYARMQVAVAIANQVNADLKAGKVLGKDDLMKVQINIMRMTITQAIEFVRSEKQSTGHRKSYYRVFTALVTNIKEWLEYQQRDDFLLHRLNQSDLFEFFRYLNQVKHVGNKTYNNYRNLLTTAINFLIKREPRLFKVNPTNVIDTLPVIVKKHAAFTDAQILLIKKRAIATKQMQLLLFIQFIYYTLARPSELLHLKVMHVDLTLKRIFIPGEFSKTKFDEYVGISDHFVNIIKESGIMNYAQNAYIFGSNGEPGAVKIASPDPFWRRNQKILKDVGLYELNENFSLYSYKHSGAISLYNASKDIKLVQRQCRHKTLNQTNDYLRDLGLVSGYEAIKSWQGAV